jgi:MFS family permease
VLAGAWSAQASVALVSFALPAIGVYLRHAYGLSLAGLGAALGAQAAGGAFSNLAAGLAVDRLGSRIPTLVGGGIAVTGLVIAGALASRGALVAGLFLFGIGSACILVAGAGAVFHAFSALERGRALGLRQTSVPIGALLGASLVPLVVSHAGPRPFFFFGAALITATASVFAALPETKVVWGRSSRGLGFLAILRTAGIGRVLAVTCAFAAVMQALVVYCVPAARAAGLSPVAAGATLVVTSATAAVARLIWGRVADSSGGSRRRLALAWAGWVGAAGAALYGLALHVGPAAALAAIVVFAFGGMGWNAVALLVAGELAPPALVARTVAVQGTVIWCVGAGAAPLFGLLAERAGWNALWFTTAAIAAVGALVAMPRERRRVAVAALDSQES